jgi:pimeloyl-ACP methyl ester carboxylesterase
VPAVTGRYVPVTVGGVTYQIYTESAGSGQDVLCMHTAGADGRQFHGLMADPRVVEHHRLVSFDLPWHGKSPLPEGAIQGSWRLNTDLYVSLIMGFIAAAGLDKPVALGASMSVTCLRSARCAISMYATRRRSMPAMLPVRCVCRSTNGTPPPRQPIPALPRPLTGTER